MDKQTTLIRMVAAITVSTTFMTTSTLTSLSSTFPSTIRVAGTLLTASTRCISTSMSMKLCLTASRGLTWSRLPQTGALAASISSQSGKKQCRNWKLWVRGCWFSWNELLELKLSSFKYFFLFLGIGIGVVDVGYERRLSNHLGAHQTPSILGVVNGKVSFFHYAVVKGHLMQFVEDLLPQRLVEKVSEHPHSLAMSASSSGLKHLFHGCL